MTPRFETPKEMLDYRRVAQALRWLDAQKEERPQIAELARAMDTSPAHLSRLFTRWAGVPPKRFLAFLTKEHAKSLLRRGASTLDASATTGLTSQSRLHDLMVTTEALTPGQYKDAGDGLEVRYGVAPSPFGHTFVATTRRGVFSMSFVESPRVDTPLKVVEGELPRARFVADDASAAAVVARAFRTDAPGSAPLSLWLRGTPFQLKVWEAVLALCPGEVASYGRVAEAVGAKGAARAVGSALGKNRIAVLVPCHRVIRAVGETSAYRWGAERKRLLLARESARASTFG